MNYQTLTEQQARKNKVLKNKSFRTMKEAYDFADTLNDFCFEDFKKLENLYFVTYWS